MEILTNLVLAAFGIVAVSAGLPPHHYNEYNFTEIFTNTTAAPDECELVIRRERCSHIMIDATSKFDDVNDDLRNTFKVGFQHYCRTIPEFLLCVEANRADYMLLMDCDSNINDFLNLLMTSADISRDQLWDMTVESFNRANDIVCSRTDEVIDVIECVSRNTHVFVPEWRSCLGEYASPLAPVFMGISYVEPLDQSELCRSTIGYVRCSWDAMAEVCPDSSDLLDTFYDDVIVDVIGNGFGCEPPSNPLLSFVRSVRDKLRR